MSELCVGSTLLSGNKELLRLVHECFPKTEESHNIFSETSLSDAQNVFLIEMESVCAL